MSYVKNTEISLLWRNVKQVSFVCHLAEQIIIDVAFAERQSSLMLVVFPSVSEALEAVDAIGETATPQCATETIKGALAAIACPGLGGVDWAPEVFGDSTAVPDYILRSAEGGNGRLMLQHMAALIPAAAKIVESMHLEREAEWRDWEEIGGVISIRSDLPLDARCPDHFMVVKDGVRIAVVHRNGMRWGKALQAVLRDGELGGDEAGVGAGMLGFAVEAAPLDLAPLGLPVIKARRRKRGTAPTSAETLRTYVWVTDELGIDRSRHPLPLLDHEAKKMLAPWLDEHAARQAAEKEFPSLRQREYANLIHHALEGQIPRLERSASRKEASLYIEKHRPDYLEFLESASPQQKERLKRASDRSIFALDNGKPWEREDYDAGYEYGTRGRPGR